MLGNIREYISSNELQITILLDRVNVLNFDRIRNITDKEVSFTKDKRKIKVIGKNLKINKLLDDEALILGNIMKVELDHE